MAPLIALEEHYFAPSDLLPSHVMSLYSEQFKYVPSVHAKLLDISTDSLRVQSMQHSGITMQILSHAPGLSSSEPEHCSQVNDFLAAKIDASDESKRLYRGLAVLPMGSPGKAAEELRRCVKELGFVGTMIDNHVIGASLSSASESVGDGKEAKYYDNPDFWPVFEAAQDLDVPIYIHPMFPPPRLAEHYTSGSFVLGAGVSMGSSGWGWHSECGLHVLRLFASGLFDKYPRLKIVVGHFGEMLPFMLDRLYMLSKRWGDRERDFRKVWKENLYLTTSGCWSVDPMATIARNTDVSNVLFSLDWPFADAEDGRSFWEDLGKSGLYDAESLEKIGWKNAAKLFKLDENELIEAAAKFTKASNSVTGEAS
jgi:predicted TIM-barrel fold metal-dependent hydrolase